MLRPLACCLLLAAVAAAEPGVAWVWSGVGSGDATVSARLTGAAGARARLVVAQDEALTRHLGTAAEAVVDADGLVRLRAEGLPAGATLWYGIAVAGAAPLPGGRLRTLPEPGKPASFRLAFASCTDQPEGKALDAVVKQDPLLFIITGDLHYDDIAVDDPARFIAAYERNLGATAFGRLFRALPVAYVWDDHDYGGNDSGLGSAARPAVHAQYRRFVPHWPLALPGADAPIAQSTVLGRVRLVITDLRSERTDDTLLGAAQKAWFLGQVAEAARARQFLLWVSSVPWNGKPQGGKDRWQSYTAERTEIADAAKAVGVKMAIIAGDAHMVAIDDGTNSDFATGGGMPIPVFQAAALGRTGSYKGGPYSHGARPGSGQFGVMEVTDDGLTLAIAWSARDGRDGVGDTVVTASKDGDQPIAWRFTVPLATAP